MMAILSWQFLSLVAPHTGNVDRNIDADGEDVGIQSSFPSRGTWIKMICFDKVKLSWAVAPHMECVGRNIEDSYACRKGKGAPSWGCG